MSSARKKEIDAPPILPLIREIEPDVGPFHSLLHPTFDEVDDESIMELDDKYWEALLPDDDYETLPDKNDFWIDQEAA